MADNAIPSTGQEARRLWNWVLAKQGLSVDSRLPDAHTAAGLSLGLHAARLPSPFATAIARTSADADLSSLLGPKPHPQLVTVRCMRKTLHMLPPQVAATALAATQHYRLRDVENLVRKAALDRARFVAAQGWLLNELSSGARSHRELETLALPVGWTTPEVRLALKWCWESGVVTYRNGSDSWHREVRQFSLTRWSYPDLAVGQDTEASKDELVRLYFERYGPATLEDASWWSGLGQQRILAALGGLEIVGLALPWANNTFYMLAQDFAAFQSAPSSWHATGLNYLAHEDVALKAYHESRSRYLGVLQARTVFNQIGEVLPTIVWDGQVVGLWRWDHRRRSIRYQHFPHVALPSEVRSSSRKLARRIRDRLRQGYT